jgi:hypothetical protein
MIAAASHVTSTLGQQRFEVIAVAIAICAVIFELVRRKRLMERYAILWLATGASLLVLALWKGLLTNLAHAAGIHYLPSALFAVAFLFVLVMLVHASITISRLSQQSTSLAQQLALLQRRVEEGIGEDADRADSVQHPPQGLAPAEALRLDAARARRLPAVAASEPQLVAERRELDRQAS